MIRKGLVLAPTAQSLDTFEALPRGKAMTVETKLPRHIRHHRLFWALLQLVFDAQDYYDTPEALLAVIKVRLGHCDIVRSRVGIVAVPRSISFAKMEQTDFNRFFDRAIDLICNELVHTLNKADLERQVHEMVQDKSLVGS